MTVTRHRIAAGAILLCGSLALVAVGRSMVTDPPEVARVRGQFDGDWVATRVQTGTTTSTPAADVPRTTAHFAGRSVKLTNLIEGRDGSGIYVVDPATNPAKVDLKVDAGWMLGIYELHGDRLTLCVNAIRHIERLGVPTRGRPDAFRPSLGRHLYEFERVTPRP